MFLTQFTEKMLHNLVTDMIYQIDFSSQQTSPLPTQL